MGYFANFDIDQEIFNHFEDKYGYNDPDGDIEIDMDDFEEYIAEVS